ncbi:hypothetical protein HGG71_02870 [Rhodobacteraceae bacterium R_SAG2]|nr:hypothetical protein [Rhodobacteraceae bacterium R_SAG2]
MAPIFKKGLAPIYVGVIDHAKDGCWTNIGEATTYATDQLQLIGIQAEAEMSESISVLDLTVTASRADAGWCFGSIEISVQAWATWRDQRRVVTLEHWTSSFAGHQNANRLVLDNIQQVVREGIADYPDERP